MEQLKTPSEKKLEIREFRRKQEIVRKREFEDCKLQILRMINDTDDMPMSFKAKGNVKKYLEDDGVELINGWLEENGYKMTESDGYVDSFHITPKDYDYLKH